MTNWYDEKEVVKVIEDFLKAKGYGIGPKLGIKGPDINAYHDIWVGPNSKFPPILVEAKGYPSIYYAHGEKAGQPKRTPPNTQARHWIAEAIFTMLTRMAEIEHGIRRTQFVLAFPRFPIYIKFMNRLKQVFREKYGIIVYIVDEDRDVREFSPTEDVS